MIKFPIARVDILHFSDRALWSSLCRVVCCSNAAIVSEPNTKMHRAFVLVVALYSMQQTQVCHGDKNPATGLPQFAKAKYFGSNTDGATRLVDPLARELRIEVAKQEILRKLGMTKRPPKMNNLLANIPKPVFDGEISSLFSNGDDEEPSKTTQVVIPADEG